MSLTNNHAQWADKLRKLGLSAAADETRRNAFFVGLRWISLAGEHLEDAAACLAAGRRRATFSRSYYAAYNASKGVRYIVGGVVSLKGDDHQKAWDLPNDFPSGDRWAEVIPTLDLKAVRQALVEESIDPEVGIVRLNRALAKLTKARKNNAFVFLDDFHYLDFDEQPKVLHRVYAALKGANGWLKVAGLRSLLNYYSARDRIGLQVPGDAQLISLDLTLENPERAETHLKAILENFLKAVGYSVSTSVLPNAAFRRLAWANAGVPRDFLQMFGRAIDHARRNKHTVVTLTDVNAGIGESGQRKMDELEQDAHNSKGELLETLGAIERICLDEERINAFLVRSENSPIRQRIHILNDLRLVHLVNQSITPDRAGERYEAYIVDYSLFTGIRRRPGVKEMLPEEGQGQFKAAQLRRLPKITEDQLETDDA